MDSSIDEIWREMNKETSSLGGRKGKGGRPKAPSSSSRPKAKAAVLDSTIKSLLSRKMRQSQTSSSSSNSTCCTDSVPSTETALTAKSHLQSIPRDLQSLDDEALSVRKRALTSICKHLFPHNEKVRCLWRQGDQSTLQDYG